MGTEAEVVRAAQGLRSALERLRVSALPGEEAASLVAELARTEKVCAVAGARLAARAAACEAHRSHGSTDAVDWLARETGTSRRAARDALTTVAALDSLPATRTAMDTGELSLAQAGEIVAAAAASPGCEARLLAHARSHDLRSLQDEARSARLAASDPAELHRLRHEARAVRHWRDRDAMVHVSAQLPPEVGLPLVHRLDAETDRIPSGVTHTQPTHW